MSNVLAVLPADPRSTERVPLFGCEIDPLTIDQAVARVLAWVAADERQCPFVVTPNVDHAVLLQHNAKLRQAYRDAALVLADGMPIVAASRLLGHSLPERVAGSDLVPAVLAAANATRPLRVFLLGAAPGVAVRAANNIEARWPGLDVVGVDSPPLGFERDADECRRIVQAINRSQADLLIIGFGAPKQELWVDAHRDQLHVNAALCVGATIDFLAGEKQRAPLWMRKAGLEWLHRVASEPRRLLKRYLRDAWIFPRLVASQWWRERRARANVTISG